MYLSSFASSDVHWVFWKWLVTGCWIIKSHALELGVVTRRDIRLFLSEGVCECVLVEHGTVMISECILVIARDAHQTDKGWTVLDSNNNCWILPLLLGITLCPGYRRKHQANHNIPPQRLTGPGSGNTFPSRASLLPHLGSTYKHWNVPMWLSGEESTCPGSRLRFDP